MKYDIGKGLLVEFKDGNLELHGKHYLEGTGKCVSVMIPISLEQWSSLQDYLLKCHELIHNFTNVVNAHDP